MKNYRVYGNSPVKIAILHGGPGAAGEVAPIAKELSDPLGVLEPFQTKDSINSQVEELKDVVKDKTSPPIILIGWSWGAWLAYIFTSKHPDLVRKLILVSSGPFDESYASKIMETRLSRLNKHERDLLTKILSKINSSDNKNENYLFNKFGELMTKADSYSPLKDNSLIKLNHNIYKKVWSEASKIRKSGKLLELSKKIKCPVVAIHGDYDPHPAAGVDIPLSKHIKDFKFILLKKCGHHPWLEKFARERFYKILREEII